MKDHVDRPVGALRHLLGHELSPVAPDSGGAGGRRCRAFSPPAWPGSTDETRGDGHGGDERDDGETPKQSAHRSSFDQRRVIAWQRPVAPPAGRLYRRSSARQRQTSRARGAPLTSHRAAVYHPRGMRPRGHAAAPHVVVTVLMLVAIADMLTGVFLRYVMTKVSAVFDLPTIRFFWVEEIGELCLAWMSFIGAAIGIRKGIHFSVQIDHRAPPARAAPGRLHRPLRAHRRLRGPGRRVRLAGRGAEQPVVLSRARPEPALALPVVRGRRGAHRDLQPGLDRRRLARARPAAGPESH